MILNMVYCNKKNKKNYYYICFWKILVLKSCLNFTHTFDQLMSKKISFHNKIMKQNKM